MPYDAPAPDDRRADDRSVATSAVGDATDAVADRRGRDGIAPSTRADRTSGSGAGVRLAPESAPTGTSRMQGVHTMFEILTDEEERGQVGIGTLIVFIAMVLVAAIAAGVLINTAGVLQSQASDTGSETQEAVANQIEVIHASGNVTDDGSGNDYVDTVNMTIMKSAGSNAIDLTSMTIQYTSDTTDVTLQHNESSPPTASTFVTENLAGEDGGSDELISTDDRVKVTLNITAIEGGSGGLEGGSGATVALVDQSGAQYTYGVSVPSTFGNKEVVEV